VSVTGKFCSVAPNRILSDNPSTACEKKRGRVRRAPAHSTRFHQRGLDGKICWGATKPNGQPPPEPAPDSEATASDEGLGKMMWTDLEGERGVPWLQFPICVSWHTRVAQDRVSRHGDPSQKQAAWVRCLLG
jgi:hypothetical protein